MSTTSRIDPTTRSATPYGGLNLTVLRIELTRVVRNRRTVLFALVFPAAIYWVIAGSEKAWDDPVGQGNVAAYILISMALYGAALTAAASGASVAVERALGWSRQLRLTPLNPVAHIVTKALVALLTGAIAITVVNACGVVQGRASMPLGVWLGAGLATLLCTVTFAALGVFVGYLVPGENAMQLLGPGLALLSFLGGVFWPLTEGSALWHVATFTPMYGVAEIARSPLTEDLSWYAVVNAIAWLVVFVAGAAWLMSKDTERG